LNGTNGLSLPRDPRAYLWDVCAAAGDIIAFTMGLSAEEYAASNITSAAVERKFEIIGEALKLLHRHYPDMASRIPELQKIVAFRNLLAHGYAVVEHERVFAITRHELLALRSAAAMMLQEIDSPKDF
jgi:uncharacterized protein with HEPN domain